MTIVTIGLDLAKGCFWLDVCCINAACCSSVFTGTNRMSGREAASQMARASWASDLPRLTKGFT